MLLVWFVLYIVLELVTVWFTLVHIKNISFAVVIRGFSKVDVTLRLPERPDHRECPIIKLVL
jgi:hypothetical protein